MIQSFKSGEAESSVEHGRPGAGEAALGGVTVSRPRKFPDALPDGSSDLPPACCRQGCGNGFAYPRKEDEEKQNIKKKPNFLVVYYLSDGETGPNCGVTFPTANTVQGKQLTGSFGRLQGMTRRRQEVTTPRES